MSNAVFPTLAGITWPLKRRPMFKNFRPESVSGREVAFSYQVYPKYELDLVFEFLRSDATNLEMQKIAGFFEARQGDFDSFLFTDWLDYTVTDMSFGVGNGAQTQFQLTRAFGSVFTAAAPVQNVNTLTNIKVAGVSQTIPTAVSINSTGLATFASPPAGAASLTWTGTFYYRCKFKESMQEYENFMYQLWKLGQCTLVGATGNRV